MKGQITVTGTATSPSTSAGTTGGTNATSSTVASSTPTGDASKSKNSAAIRTGAGAFVMLGGVLWFL